MIIYEKLQKHEKLQTLSYAKNSQQVLRAAGYMQKAYIMLSGEILNAFPQRQNKARIFDFAILPLPCTAALQS